MLVLAERTSLPLRARLVECDCGVPGCSTVFVVLQVADSRDLWLTIGAALEGERAAAAAVDDFLDAPDRDLGDYTLRQMVERGMALVGLEWSSYTSLSFSNEVLVAQLAAWTALPSWMERLPAGKLWAVRKVVFGRELTRVPRALYAEAQSYVPERAEAYRDFEQDVRWGLEVLSRGNALVRTTSDIPVPEAVFCDMARWDS